MPIFLPLEKTKAPFMSVFILFTHLTTYCCSSRSEFARRFESGYKK